MTASWNAGCKPGNPAAGQAGTDWADIVRNVPDLWLLSRDRGQVSEIVAVGAVGNGFQVFRVTPVGHANAFELAPDRSPPFAMRTPFSLLTVEPSDSW